MVNLDDSPEVITFAIIGNVLNLAYNIPFVYLVWKNKSSKNISRTFLNLRFLGSIAWLIYAILIFDIWVGVSYIITLTATCLIYYIKCLDMKRKVTDKEITNV